MEIGKIYGPFKTKESWERAIRTAFNDRRLKITRIPMARWIDHWNYYKSETMLHYGDNRRILYSNLNWCNINNYKVYPPEDFNDYVKMLWK